MTKLESLIKDLKKANRRLKEATKARPTRMNKDATIQRFEFTFELAWKAIQAYVRDQGFDCKSPKNCIREGAKLEIIDNPETWFAFLRERNLVAHTYNEKLADRIYRQALKFPKEVDKLLAKIT
jgi:nucleotidyltransferase substrate binding protein (TIGR01987 family)